MNLITLDFETYYDSKIKLGFKHQTTEEYIRDKRFEVIGVGVKVGDGVTEWFSGSHLDIQKYLSTLPWKDSALLCHNTLFDGSILAWKFGINILTNDLIWWIPFGLMLIAARRAWLASVR